MLGRDDVEGGIREGHAGQRAALRLEPALAAELDGELREVQPHLRQAQGLRRREHVAGRAPHIQQAARVWRELQAREDLPRALADTVIPPLKVAGAVEA